MESERVSPGKMPEPILVTGGAGFIGSHLCEALMDEGWELWCVDNFCDFYAPATKEANIAPLLSHPSFHLIRADIRDKEAMRQLFAQRKFYAVCHLAAMAGVRPSIQDPELYMDVNINGTLQLLQLCKEYDVQRFIFASSSSVYGNSPSFPSGETDFVDYPISPYAASKKAGELLCHTWHHLWGISIVCLRFFTVYGPRQRPDLAIHKFASLLAKDQPLPYFGDGESSRDYTYIEDTIAGILATLSFLAEGKRFEVINLGNDHSIPLCEVVQELERLSGKKAQIHSLPAQEGDVHHTRACIQKAHQLLGYRPQTSFQQGMQRFWNWFERQRKQE